MSKKKRVKSKAVKAAPKKGKKAPATAVLNRKLDKILKTEKLVLKEEKNIKAKESKIESEERKIESEEQSIEAEEKTEGLNEADLKNLEQKQLEELDKLEKIEKEVQDQIKQHPLTKITRKDVWRGSLGAFVGIILHYTVFYGVEIAENLNMPRATIIYILSFVVGMVFLYLTGFKKVNDTSVIKFLPVRMIVLYTVSIVISVAVLLLFFPHFGSSFASAYKQTATVSLIAVIGACTADLIARD